MKCVVGGGSVLAENIKNDVAMRVCEISERGVKICFVAVLVGDNPASEIYVAKKQKACDEVGIHMRLVRLPATITMQELIQELQALSNDNGVHGILLQLPLPHGLDADLAIKQIAPVKDVDGLTYANFGALAMGKSGLVPCTALGVLHILKEYRINLVGANAVVIGRSNIVGKPVAMLLSQENATVTLAHSKTKNLKVLTRKADIIVVAVGTAKLLTASMIKRGAVVIDVGINRTDNGIVGDVDFEKVAKRASLVTPVPGGVGPLTIAFLLRNIVHAYEQQIDRRSEQKVTEAKQVQKQEVVASKKKAVKTKGARTGAKRKPMKTKQERKNKGGSDV